MNIIGQDKLLNTINELNLDTFPRSVMLLGAEGSGRHSIVYFIAKHLSLPIEDISEKLTLETIDDITTRSSPSIYIINTKDITVKEQNTILKFIEEPLKNAYVIVLAESKNRLLDTVLNRCLIWQLENYSRETLEKFLPQSNQSSLILEIAATPGQVLKYQSIQFEKYVELADKIINCIDFASVPNTLTLVDKLKYKEEDKGELDANIFFSILLHQVWQASKNCLKPYADIMYVLTNKLKNDLLIANIDKKALFENYLLKLWVEVRR